MNYDDYKQNIVNQLMAKTGLELVWEDFVLSDQKVVSGKTIQVTIKPSSQGSDKMKGSSTFNIDRMDLSNKTYVFDWQNDIKVFNADVLLHDKTPSGQAELLSMLSEYLGVSLSTDDFEAVLITPDPRYDVTVELTAKSTSFYYYGTLRVTLTHPWINQVVMDVSLPGNVSVTPAVIGYGSLYVDGVYQPLPYTIIAGNHKIEIKNFGLVSNGFKFLGPTRLRLLRVYSGTYTQLFKDCVNLTTIDEECIHAAGGLSTNISNLFWGCSGLKTLPSVLFMRDSSVYRISGLLRATGIESVSSTLFKNLDLQDTTLDMVFMDTLSLREIPADLFTPIGANVISSTQLFQNSGVSVIPEKLLAAFPSLKTLSSMFMSCLNVETVPTNLLNDSPGLTTLTNVFYGCTKLKVIPDGFFKDLSQLTVANGVFKGCVSVTDIAADFLSNNPSLIQVRELFMRTSIASIPSGFFDANSKIVYADSLMANNTALSSIPEALFINSASLSVVNNIFDGCISLTSIPSDLFKYTTKLTNVAQAFRGVTQPFAIPGDFFPGAGIRDASGVFQNSGLVSIEAGLFSSHTTLRAIEYAFAGTAIDSVPANVFITLNATLIKADGVFSGCSRLVKVSKGAIDVTTGITDGGGSFVNFFANCPNLLTIEDNAVQINGMVFSINGFLLNAGKLVVSTTALLKKIVIGMTNQAGQKFDASNFCNGVIWLTGSCMELWNAMTNSVVPNANRIRLNFVEQCFLLDDYEAVKSPWWTTAINLSRADGNALDVFTMDKTTKPAGHAVVPLFASYYVNIPRDTLSNSFGTLDNVEITGAMRVWLSRVFLTLGLTLPTTVKTVSLMSRAYGSIGFPTAYVRPEVRLVACLVFDRSITTADWNSPDTYLLCSLTS